MTDSDRALQETLARLVDSATGPFRLDELARGTVVAAGGKPIAPALLAKALRESSLTFHEGETDRHIPRRIYFKGAQFRVVPLDSEVESGSLLPGHRLMPFCRRDVFPADSLLETADGRPIPKKTVKQRVVDVLSRHSLFGWQNMIDYFASDDESNAVSLSEVDLEKETLLTLTAFDLREAFRAWNFAPGDSLKLTVLDWSEARFLVEHAPEEKAGVDRAALEKRWRQTLEDALEEVIDESGVLLDVHEQLSLAFFYGGKSLLENPVLGIGQFLAKSRRIRLCHMGTRAIFWNADGEPDRTAFPDMDLTRRATTGAVESLDGMLRDLRVSLRSSDIEAYMRDEIFRGGSSLGDSLQRCLRWRGELNFHDDRQRFAFSREIEKLWVRVLSEPSRADGDCLGRQRSRALKIMDAKLEWLTKLDRQGVRVDEVPGAEFLRLSQLMSSLSSLLEALNATDASEITEESELARTLDELDASSKRLMDSVEARIELIRLATGQD